MSATTAPEARHGGTRRRRTVINAGRLGRWTAGFVVVQAVASAWQISATAPGAPDRVYAFASHPTWWLVALTVTVAVVGWRRSARAAAWGSSDSQTVLRRTVHVQIALTVAVVIALPVQMVWVAWAVHRGVLDPVTLPNVVLTVRHY
ncbi:hypothetical protein ACLBWP_13545 [Microbacterium sp. M1A1_1b]